MGDGKLKTIEKAEDYRNKENDRLQKTENRGKADEIWNSINKWITEAAIQAVGEKRRRNEDWFDQECREAIKDKNKARIAILHRNTRTQRMYIRKREG